jgi:hypothetical protein
MPDPIFLKLGTYIMALEPPSMTYFLNTFHQSVCLYAYPPIVDRQLLGVHVTAAMVTGNKEDP